MKQKGEKMEKTTPSTTPTWLEEKPNYLLDSELLQLVELAETGCIDSQEELFLCFADGIRAMQDYEIAEYYLELALKTIESKYEGHPKGKYSILWNKVRLACVRKDGDIEEKFFEMVDFLKASLPISEWDLSHFEFVKKSLQSMSTDHE